MKFKKLRTTINYIMLISIITIIVIVFVPTLLISSKNIKETKIKEYETLNELSAKKIDISLNNISQSVINISNYIESTINMDVLQSNDKDRINIYMKDYIKKLNGFMVKSTKTVNDNIDVYITFNFDLINNEEYPYQSLLTYDIYNDSYSELKELAKISDFDSSSSNFAWYFDPIYSSSGIWSNPYDDSYVGKKIFTFSYPVYVDDIFVGIVGIDSTFDQIKELINKYNVKNTYSILMNKKYYHLVHPVYGLKDNLRKIENGNLAFIADFMDKNKQGYLKYRYKGKTKYVVFTRLSNDWIITTNITEWSLLKSIRNQYVILLVAVLLGIIISIIASYRVGNYISKPIEDLTKLFDKISRFDLRDSGENILYTLYPNEIGKLSSSIYDMLIDQRKIVGTIVGSTEEFNIKFSETNSKLLSINRSTEDQYFSTKELNKALEEISVTMNDIYNSIYEYSKINNEKSEFMNGLFIMISEVNSNLEESIATLEIIENNSKNITEEAKDVYISLKDSLRLSNMLYDLVSKFKI